jgi:hypothetical protein
MTRYALRRDTNESIIVEALREAGATVTIIGLPVDLLVMINGKFMFMEIKDGEKLPSQRKKTKVQEKFFADHPNCPVSLVDSVEAALRALTVFRGAN